MKKHLYKLLLITCIWGFSQEKIEAKFISSKPLKADKYISTNVFDELFYILDNTLYKQTKSNTYSYKNIALNNIYSVDVLNPFELTLFYKDFNTVIQLDNKLNEINKVDFNLSKDFKNIGFAATASNKRLWTFNADNFQLELYNFQSDTIEAFTQPISLDIISYYSNYNFCWLLTNAGILQYNVYGNLLNIYEFSDFEDFTYYNKHFFLKKKNELYALHIEEKAPKLINLPQLNIKDFSLTNETLYIYDGKAINTFSINLKKE